MKKASDNVIQSLDVDWGIGDSTTEGLPCSGRAVQNFIKEQLRELAASNATLSAAKADKADYVVLSEDEYEALAVKDANKFYFLYEE